MLKIAIIGIGWAGTRHIQAIRELDRKVDIVCLVDQDVEFLEAKAKEFGIRKIYTDYQDALATPVAQRMAADLGTYQNILLLEIDGPKTREIRCKVIEN